LSVEPSIPLSAERDGGRRWQTPVAASVAGRAHRARGIEIQDAWRARSVKGGAVCLVVADGASSCSHPGEGAHIAAGLAVDILARYLDRHPRSKEEWLDLLSRSLDLIRQEFLRVTAEMGDPSSYATTLTNAILISPWLGLASVGNCFGVARIVDADDEPGRKRQYLQLALEPPPVPGEYSNATTFLTSADARDRYRFRIIYAPRLDGLALCSDGCTEGSVVYSEGEPTRPYPPFFDKVFAAADAEGNGTDAMLHLLADGDPAESVDDKTIVAVARESVSRVARGSPR
jgi:hypothetical protein